MKQAIVVSFLLIIIITVFVYGIYNTKLSNTIGGAKTVEVLKSGEIIYETPLQENQILLIVESTTETIVLKDEEIMNFYDLETKEIQDQKIYDVSGESAIFNLVIIENETVDVYEANCKNQICVETKSIDSAGEAISCAPHEFVVRIIGESEIDG